MRQSRYISEFFHAFIPALCLSFLLLPSTSFAGGLGDLFPRDIVDKIKSTDLKDFIRPSRETENTSEPASSQDNTTAAPAVAHKQQETKPIENTTKQPVAVDPAVAKEAEEFKAGCYKNPNARINHDCECVASRFIVERQAAPDVGQDTILARITNWNQCSNLDGIKAEAYKQCVLHQAFGVKGIEQEAYCQCYGKRIAEKTAEVKGIKSTAGEKKFGFGANMYCRKPEAYR